MELFFYGKKKGHKRHNTDKMIRESLDKYTSGHFLAPYDGKIKRTRLGKPYLSNNALYIGVTHTDDVVICAIDTDNFGIDCECESRKVRKPKALASKFFCENEEKYIENMCDGHKAFLEIWVKKEAYSKFTGEGISSFKSFDVTTLSGFEYIKNDRNLIIYIYRENKNE